MTTPTNRLKIMARDLFNIFQLYNPAIFEPIISDEDAIKIFERTVSMVDYFESPTSDVLTSPDIESFSTSYKESDTGGFIIVTALKKKIEGRSETEDWLFITIGDTIDHGEHIQDLSKRYELLPLFALTGIVENNSVFVPHDCGAKTILEDGETALMFPNTPDDFYALVLYADAAFRAIMTNDTMDLNKFAFYLDPSQVQVSRNEYHEIKNRTATDLAKYIVECADLNHQMPTTSFPQMPAPPMLQ